MDPLAWSALLLLLGLTLVVLEVFVPSGGMLGFLSIGSLTASIILAFYNRGAAVGFLFLAITAAAVPTMLVYLPLVAQDRRRTGAFVGAGVAHSAVEWRSRTRPDGS